MLNQFVNTLAGIIYPPVCLLCRQRLDSADSNNLICSGCALKIRPNLPPFCRKCGRNISGTPANLCHSCAQSDFYFEKAVAPCPYEGAIKELIHNFKYKHKLRLGAPLSQMMINFIRDYHLPITQCDYIIPIPLSGARLREREFNQARILADKLSRHFHIEMLTDCLRRIRNTQSQAELDKEKRRENMRGAFGIKNPGKIKNKSILLVDDVLTTGATASEASGALKASGASSVFVLTVAN